MAYHRELGTDTCILRIFNTYGPRMRPTTVGSCRTSSCQALRGKPLTIYGDGAPDAQLLLRRRRGARHPRRCSIPARRGPVNIGNDGEFTMLELAELVLEVTGSSVGDRVRAAARGRPDATPARPDHRARRRARSVWEPSDVRYSASGSRLTGPPVDLSVRRPRPRPRLTTSGRRRWPTRPSASVDHARAVLARRARWHGVVGARHRSGRSQAHDRPVDLIGVQRPPPRAAARSAPGADDRRARACRCPGWRSTSRGTGCAGRRSSGPPDRST